MIGQFGRCGTSDIEQLLHEVSNFSGQCLTLKPNCSSEARLRSHMMTASWILSLGEERGKTVLLGSTRKAILGNCSTHMDFSEWTCLSQGYQLRPRTSCEYLVNGQRCVFMRVRRFLVSTTCFTSWPCSRRFIMRSSSQETPPPPE